MTSNVVALVLTATPVHAVIDDSVRASINHEWWELPVTFGGIVISAVAAIATLYLAIQTRKLADKTAIVAEETASLAKETLATIAVSRDAVAAEDRRHVQTFMPHIAIECRLNKISERRLVTAGSAGRLPEYREVTLNAIDVYARNIGPGYATNVVASNQNIPNNNIVRPLVPIAFAANSEPVLLIRRKDGNETLMGWNLKYEDAFGNKFESMIEDNIQEYTRYKFHTSPLGEQ